MLDNPQIVDQVNRTDDECPTEQPPNNVTEISDFVLSKDDDDAAAAADSASPPKVVVAEPASPPKVVAAEPASLPNDNASSSASPPKVVAAEPASLPKGNASSSASPPRVVAAKLASLSKDNARSSASPPNDGPSSASSSSLNKTAPLLSSKKPKFMPKTEPKTELSTPDALAATNSDDVKPIIKHETIDLGEDTHFYDDTNKATKCCPKNGFDRGLEPDHIIGATEKDGKLKFLVAWKNSDDCDLVESTKVYKICPQIAIKFFEERLTYKSA